MSNSSHRATRRARRLVTVAFVASGVLLPACSFGGGETLSEVPPGIGEDEGDPTPPPYSPGAPVVARLQTENPDMATFMIRGTFPVPRGTYPRGDQMVPFTVLDWDGSPVWTQVETVTRYPDAADGASVVEVMARVRPHPGVAVGSQVTYDVQSHLLPTENDLLQHKQDCVKDNKTRLKEVRNLEDLIGFRVSTVPDIIKQQQSENVGGHDQSA